MNEDGSINCIWMGQWMVDFDPGAKHFDGSPVEDQVIKAGWAFYLPNQGVNWYSDTMYSRLSPHYRENVASVRYPIAVALPRRGTQGSVTFCVDSLSTAKLEPWDVTVDLATLVRGAQPDITVHPSIRVFGAYHGHVLSGVITKDHDDD